MEQQEQPDRSTSHNGATDGSDAPATPSVSQSPTDVKGMSLTILAVAAGIALLRYMQDVMIPVVLSILLFYAMDPFVDRLQKLRVPRPAGAALALLLLVFLLSGLTYSLSDDVVRVAAELPTAAQKLRAAWRRERGAPPGAIETLQRAADELEKTAKDVTGATPPEPGVMRVEVAEPTLQAADYVRWGTSQAVTVASQGIMVLFLAFFLLNSDDLFKRKFVEIIGPTLTHKKITVQALNEIAEQIERFMLVQLFTSAVVAVVTWLALWWLGVNQAAVWGLAAGVLNSVPYFGPLIVTGGLAIVGFVQFGTLSMAAIVGGVALAITTIEGWFLTPALMGRVAQMNTVAIFAGLLFWSWMWGVWGLLLAVPIMMVVKVTCDRLEGFQPVGKLLGE